MISINDAVRESHEHCSFIVHFIVQFIYCFLYLDVYDVVKIHKNFDTLIYVSNKVTFF